MNTSQFKSQVCQSCAMPMQKPEDFGTNSDGNQNNEYCRYCFQKGGFTAPDLTLEQMTEKCANIMKQMRLPDVKIEQAKAVLPSLKRWGKQ